MTNTLLAPSIFISNEVIEDPIAFLDEHRELLTANYVRGASPGVVIAPNVEFCHGLGEKADRSRNRLEIVSPFLGSLYTQNVIHDPWLTTFPQRYSVRAFPSSKAVNRLISALGFEPGVDAFEHRSVLEVESSDYGFPGDSYCRYLSVGQFPRSSNPSTFQHDREHDHVPGVLAMSGWAASRIIAQAVATEESSPIDERREKQNSITLDFDIDTGILTGFAEKTAEAFAKRDKVTEAAVLKHLRMLIRQTASNRYADQLSSLLSKDKQLQDWRLAADLTKTMRRIKQLQHDGFDIWEEVG